MKVRDLNASSRPTDIQVLSAFGQRVEILHSGDGFEAQSRIADLHQIYEVFLASRVIPKSGVLADIGAGAGWFAVPFAKAFPDWQILCFEADEDTYCYLSETVHHNKLENVTCIRAAFCPEADPGRGLPQRPQDTTKLPAALRKALEAPATAPFRYLPGLGRRMAPAGVTKGGAEVLGLALAPALLTALAPDLVKLDAPGCETALAEALRGSPTGFVTGKLYEYVPSRLLNPVDLTQPRQIYLPHGPHVLRRDYEDSFIARKPRLDVVVAMYNTRPYIQECVDSILADGNPDITVLVVDDGSTDGCGDFVEQLYEHNPRVLLLRKDNGGCASARNFGRVHSHAAHISFVDADDRVDPGMFSALLEVARYTGLNMVEGEFSLLEVSEEGQEELGPSYEQDEHAQVPKYRLCEIEYLIQPGAQAMQSQPTIWRRVYRRDFLDNKEILFPEHVRAFDDQIFQILSAQYCGNMAHVFGHAYHYRQHSAQDIMQGDERHFYSFNMFRLILRRAQRESWPEIKPVIGALLNTMSWSYGKLRPDLKPIYQEAAVEFLAMIAKAFGTDVLAQVDLGQAGIEGLALLLELRLHEVRDSPQDYGMVHLEDWRWQPEFIRMMQAIQ